MTKEELAVIANNFKDEFPEVTIVGIAKDVIVAYCKSRAIAKILPSEFQGLPVQTVVLGVVKPAVDI